VGPFSSQSLRVPLVARVFQLAAKHKVRYRRAYEAALITLETFGMQGLTPSTSSTNSSSSRSGYRADREAGAEEDVLAEGRDDLLPPLYIGQPPRIPSRGSAPVPAEVSLPCLCQTLVPRQAPRCAVCLDAPLACLRHVPSLAQCRPLPRSRGASASWVSPPRLGSVQAGRCGGAAACAGQHWAPASVVSCH